MTATVVVVGGGLAGLMATMKLASLGHRVKLVSVTPVKRSHSVCAQGGMNAALDRMGEGDSPIRHAWDTIKGGDFLANQPPVVEMCMAGPAIIDLLDRLGCCFNRTAEGLLDVRRFGGTLYSRTVFCNGSTGQQMLYTLDEQVRRWEVAGRVEKWENWEFLRVLRDSNGTARGVVVMDLFNLRITAIEADAVVMATGGPGLIFKQSTNSTFCTGAANGRLYMQGMEYANGEFIQIHPTAIPGADKMRLISETCRGSGGRLWVPGNGSKTIVGPDGKTQVCGETGQPWYFLEALYPAYGNLVPRDIASREILRICQMGLGVDGAMQVYLDVTALDSDTQHKLGAILEIYEKFTGFDPRRVPMKIFPAVHYSMGGAWVDWPAADAEDRSRRYRQMTNIPGCFSCGESDYEFHGANRLGGNSLLSCLFGGLVAAQELVRYLDSAPRGHLEAPPQVALEEEARQQLLQSDGQENAFELHEQLAELMIHEVTVQRSQQGLQKAVDGIAQLRQRATRIGLPDRSTFANPSFAFAFRLPSMLALADCMARCALNRTESRGAHYRTDFPSRDDAQWLKTTIARYSPEGPQISYRGVDLRHFEPVPRTYTAPPGELPPLRNPPKKVVLPL